MLRLLAIDYAEAAKRRREDAQNGLEAYLYRMRELLENTDESNPFMKCSKVEERQAIEKEVSATLAWMHDDADDAKLSDFLEKKRSLE